jgi:hypothetical protein
LFCCSVLASVKCSYYLPNCSKIDSKQQQHTKAKTTNNNNNNNNIDNSNDNNNINTHNLSPFELDLKNKKSPNHETLVSTPASQCARNGAVGILIVASAGQ